MHVGSMQFRILGLVVIGTISSFIACSGGGSSINPAQTSSTSPAPRTPPPVPTLSVPFSVTTGATGLTASVTSEQGEVTYAWTIEDGAITSATTGASVTFSAGSAGNLTLTCTASNAYGSTTATATVNVVPPAPIAPVLTSPATATTGTTALMASVTAIQPDVNYAWTITGGTITAGASSSQVTFTAGAVGTLTLTCTAENISGAVSTNAVVNVVPQAPIVPVITYPSQVTSTSTSNTASIPAQAGCTYTWAITGGTIDSGQGTTAITFNPSTGSTAIVLTATAINSVNVSNSAHVNITVIPPPPPPTVGYYGSKVNGDNLANQLIGYNTAVDVCNRKASIRFRATHTGTLAFITPKFVWSSVKAGYGYGTGGTIQVQVQTDDGTANHFPSGTTLATMVYNTPITVGNYFPKLTFAAPPTLTSGTLYHVVFTNIDADPTTNFVSLDHIYMYQAATPTQPTWPDTDLGLCQNDTTGAWVKFNQGTGHSWTPVLEVGYADGFSQGGQGYIQGYITGTTSGWINPKPITSTQFVREMFTVSGANRVANAVAVRVNRTVGTGSLIVSVLQSNGTQLYQGTVSVPAGAVSDVAPLMSGETWVKLSFPSPITLTAGTTYYLQLSSPAGTTHTTHALEKGSMYGLLTTIYFGDGYCQFNPGTGWTDWDLWGMANLTCCDLQFYFVTQ